MTTPFWRPIWRSRPFGHRHLRAGAILKVGLLTLLGPAALMALLSLPFFLMASGNDSPVLSAIDAVAVAGFLSPFIGIYAVPFALLLGAWAMRFGMAGWGVAIVASALLPPLLGALYLLLDPTAAAVAPMLILTPVVMLHAVALWSATRWICPEALLPGPDA